MNDDNHDNQAKALKLSENFVDFIDLTDENLEEVAILEFGIQGGVSCATCGGGGGCGCRYRGACRRGGGCGCRYASSSVYSPAHDSDG